MSDIQSKIDSILARTQTVISDVTAYKQEFENLPEPDTDNISTDVVSMSINASSSYNITCGAASIAVSTTATSIDGINITNLEQRVTDIETAISALQTTVADHESRIAALETPAP